MREKQPQKGHCVSQRHAGRALKVEIEEQVSGSSRIDTTHLRRCIGTLSRAFDQLGMHDADSVMHDVFRAACVKEFELVLEQSGKLLSKRIRPWFASNRQVDKLTFKDFFRHAAKHGLIEPAACERWLQYRDNRNDTAHEYGEDFAVTTLNLLPEFIADAEALADLIESEDDD